MVTLALGLALGLERLSKLTLLATGLIALGTYTATASEAASGGFPRQPTSQGREGRRAAADLLKPECVQPQEGWLRSASAGRC